MSERTNPFSRGMLGAAALFLALPVPAALGQVCADECLLGEASAAGTCELLDTAAGSWTPQPDVGAGELHNRARAYLPWLRNKLMPAGGVMSATFTDDGYTRVAGFDGRRDAAIWTGTYLAAEALRALSTGAPDARREAEQLVSVLHRWWNIAGDRGYLARFAAPSSSPPAVQATLPLDDPEVHHGWVYDDVLWDWRGNISRDQYQGVLLGYSHAYEALAEPVRREQIRSDLVEFAEQLMERRRQRVLLRIDDVETPLELELENVVYVTAEMVDGTPTLEVDLSTGEVNGRGLLVFWPNPSEYVRQIPGFGWFPDIELPTQALQLGAAFALALEVTEGVPEYAQRRAAIAEYFAEKAPEWLETAERWANRNRCGDSYHGLNIGFMPMYVWVRAETDPSRLARLRAVLAERMWPAVAADKNVFFAFIYASQAAGSDEPVVVAEHLEQLSGFPTPPNRAVPVDLLGQYPEDPDCPGLSAVAVDVGERPRASFTWERQPWKLSDPGVPNRLYGGVDYLIAYWMGRYYGYIADDAPATCLAWRGAGWPEQGPPGFLEIPQPGSYQSGIGLVSGWFCGASQIDIQIDNGRLIPVGYGTERADTASVCGDINNGFGFLINYNALADGTHRVVAYADGIPFASSEFNVRTLGEELAEGLSAAASVPGFPSDAQVTHLRWQQATQAFSIVGLDQDRATPNPTFSVVDATGALEIPPSDSVQSGIGLVSGWHCDADRIDIRLDGGRLIPAASGTERADTESVCGDQDNGFGFLINFSALGDGPHTVDIFTDGTWFTSASFSVQTLGSEFMRGLSNSQRLPGFPAEGLSTLLQWQEANQGFVISGVALETEQ